MIRRDPGQEQEEDIQEAGLLTVREVSKALRVDETTTRRWIKDGTLEAITLPHRNKRRAYRIKQAVLDEIMKEKTL